MEDVLSCRSAGPVIGTGTGKKSLYPKAEFCTCYGSVNIGFAPQLPMGALRFGPGLLTGPVSEHRPQ